MSRLLRARATLGQRRTLRILRGGLDALLAATLAPECAACGAALDSPSSGCVCRVCWNSIEPASRFPWTDTDIIAGAAGGRYEAALRDIIHAFKYQGRRSLATPLAALMRSAAPDLLHDADCVVPVPLHPFRRLRRGFNQAADLAGALDKPVIHALWRSRPTPSQMGLGGSSRRLNVHGAFILSPFLGATWLDHPIEDKVIVLIDDVRTTGATLKACAQTLKQGGAREVRALTAAIADARLPYVQSRALTAVNTSDATA